jgi:hypothetical protein
MEKDLEHSSYFPSQVWHIIGKQRYEQLENWELYKLYYQISKLY